MKLLGLDPATAKRSIFTEITEKAVKEAIANPQILNMNPVHAQQARFPRPAGFQRPGAAHGGLAARAG
jgi:DNA topoisomerase IA